MLPLKGSNSLNYVYRLRFSLPENHIITSQWRLGLKFIPFKLTEGRRQKFLMDFN